jgi:exodeoxyribonuclease V gamma subunit
VPLAELLDALDATTEDTVRERIAIEHPLQPFDVRNVAPGALIKRAPDQPFSFDATVLRAARAALGDRDVKPPFVDGPLSIADADADVALADLVGFFKDPVRGFFRALDYTFPADVDGVEDAMPVEINPLEEWTVGDRMLADMLRGLPPKRALNAEWCRGTLPPGQLGWRKAKDILDKAVMLADEAMELRSESPRAVDVDIDLGTGRRLTGTITPVFGDKLVSVTYSKLDGKHLLAAWIPLLALAAQAPGDPWSAVCIGRSKTGTRVRREVVDTNGVPAVELLADLVTIYEAGRREPIPLPLKTSFAWAEARRCGEDPVKEAGHRWRSTDRYPGEDSQPAHLQAWGAQAPLEELMQPLRPGEEHPGEENRLGAFAARVWLPLLQAMQGGR